MKNPMKITYSLLQCYYTVIKDKQDTIINVPKDFIVQGHGS